jgi:outer membrane protein insertion porin family
MRTSGVVAALLLFGAVRGGALAGQDPLTSIRATTEVRSIAFAFPQGQTLEEADLRAQLATTARSKLAWLQQLLSWLPAIPPVLPHPFEPIALQRDVARLRQFYHRNGFLDADVRYDVVFDADDDRVDIRFIVVEGRPLAVASLTFQSRDTSPPLLAPELVDEWSRFVERYRRAGGRWTQDRERTLADSTIRWLRDRGYAHAMARTAVRVDTAAARASVSVIVDPGTRSRVRDVIVSGNTSVAAGEVRRQVPLEAGDWFSATRLEQARLQLMQFDVIRLALVQVPQRAAGDSLVDVHVQVTENEPHVIRAELGVSSGSGIGGQADWTHRSFLGGLRTLTLGIGAQTGILPLENPARREYRLSVSAFEPYVGDRRLSLAVGPFVEFRDDVRDRSWRVGAQGSLVFATGPLRSVALGMTFARRRILQYGFGDIAVDQYLPLLGLADPQDVNALRSTLDHGVLTLSAAWGRLDRFASPRKGFVIRPKLEITTPFLNTAEYGLVDLGAAFFLPLWGDAGTTIRASAGRIFPMGRSLPAAGRSPVAALLALHDVTFTAGGTRDVRGWGSDLLGPKLPKVEPRFAGDSVTYAAEQYTPIGGLARIVGSAQVNVPLPGFDGRLQSFVFLDAARVWTPDARFAIPNALLAQDRWFVGTGAGVGYETVVGAVDVALGYKLNPSPLDLRDPGAVMRAFVAGRPVGDVPADARRRWQLHFSVGATF